MCRNIDRVIQEVQIWMLCVQVVFYLKQMSPEEVDEKYANVMHQSHMLVYTTA